MVEICVSLAAKIAEYMVEPTIHQLRYVFCFNNIVKDRRKETKILKEKRKQVQEGVKQARGNQEEIKNDVMAWLTDVEIITKDVKNQELEEEKKKSCLNGCLPNWYSRYQLSRKAMKKKFDIVELQQKANFTRVCNPTSFLNTGVISSDGFMSSRPTEVAINRIMEAFHDDNVHTIGLHGMGGVGKTTLVYELSRRVKGLKLFNEVIIVTVSQSLDINNIQDQFVDFLRFQFEQKTKEGKTSMLWSKLSNINKILIILDDVWKHLDLKDVGIPFGGDRKGYKILLTTRHQYVCTSMGCQKNVRMDLVTTDEAWALFMKKANLVDDSSTLTIVAKEVARECKGLPLAIVTVGRALQGKNDHLDWMEALEQLKSAAYINIEGVDREIYPCLKLSYDYLKRKDLKSCFLLCSLFPEDYNINVEDLTKYGWGIGLFREGKTIEDVRRKMQLALRTLQNSGLLIDTNVDGIVKMHDIVRDVALWIASEGENAFMVRTGARLDQWPLDNSCGQYTAISLMANKIKEIHNRLVYPNLNILFLDGFDVTISDTFFEEMKALKGLRLKRGIFSTESLQFLTNLETLHLRYCDLRNVSLLGKMKKIEILILEGCDIVELPNDMGELQNLRSLELKGCSMLERIPSNMIKQLSKLEVFWVQGYNYLNWEVDGTSEERSNPSLWELHSLSNLAALSLTIENRHLPRGFVFPNLSRCSIITDNGPNSSREIMQQRLLISRVPIGRTLGFFDINDATILEAFKVILPTVQHLLLSRSSIFQNIIPQQMDQGGLKHLISVHVCDCQELECIFDSTHLNIVEANDRAILHSKLTSLKLFLLHKLRYIWWGPTKHVNLQNLRDVEVRECYKLESLFSSSLARSLVQLQSLRIRGCRELKQDIIVEPEDGEILSESDLRSFCLSKLTKVIIYGCDKLECVFPVFIIKGLPQLEELRITGCGNLKQVFGDERAEQVFVGNRNPIELPNLQILELRNLNSFTGFSKGDNHWVWPSLQELVVESCFNLMTSFVGDLQANVLDTQKQLRVLKMSGQLYNEMVELLRRQSFQNLEVLRVKNLEGEELFDDEFSGQQLRVLELTDAAELREIWKCPMHISSFPKLQRITIVGCSKLKSLFPIIISTSLPNLDYLRVEGASQLEEVFKHDENVMDIEKKIVLHQLRFLNLQNLPRVVSFCPEGYHFIFPSLQVLDITNCPNITTSFTIDTNGGVHAHVRTEGDMPESSSTSQSIITTMPSGLHIYWNRYAKEMTVLPPYSQEFSEELTN